MDRDLIDWQLRIPVRGLSRSIFRAPGARVSAPRSAAATIPIRVCVMASAATAVWRKVR